MLGHLGHNGAIGLAASAHLVGQSLAQLLLLVGFLLGLVILKVLLAYGGYSVENIMIHYLYVSETLVSHFDIHSFTTDFSVGFLDSFVGKSFSTRSLAAGCLHALNSSAGIDAHVAHVFVHIINGILLCFDF